MHGCEFSHPGSLIVAPSKCAKKKINIAENFLIVTKRMVFPNLAICQLSDIEIHTTTNVLCLPKLYMYFA